MSFLQLDDVRLFFTDEGEGAPILFVHGYTGESHDWSWQLPHFIASHRCIAADLRGHGRSSAPDDGYEPRVFAADLAALLRHLDCGPVVAIGHSLGGMVVSTLAVEHPDLVRALVAVDPAYLVPDAIRDSVGPLRDAVATMDDPAPFVQQLITMTPSPARPAFLTTWHRRRIAGMEPHVLRQTLLGLAANPDGRSSRSEGVAFMASRRCPVLSLYVDPERADFERALFTDERSRSYSWPGSGHFLQEERSAEFNAVVDGWLATLD